MYIEAMGLEPLLSHTSLLVENKLCMKVADCLYTIFFLWRVGLRNSVSKLIL